MLSYTITSAINAKLQHLQQLFAKQYAILTNLPQEELEAIHRYARISMVGASTRIENALLTDTEIDWMDTVLSRHGRTTDFVTYQTMIEDKLEKDRERSIEEVAGCRAMLFIIYEQATTMFPIKESDIRGLHYELMHYYKKAHPIGAYKTSANSVVEHNAHTKKIRTVFKTADPGPITKTAMADLVKWYNGNIKHEPWSIAVACEFVFRFLAIHPFQDGNGRLGRGLFFLSLLQSPNPVIAYLANYLAIDRHIERHKAEYYLVLNRCSDGQYSIDPKQYKIEHFLHYMIKILEEALADIEVYRKKYAALQTLSISSQKVLSCFKEHPELRLTTRAICEELNLPRRTVINALTKLMDAKMIHRFGKGAGVHYQLIF